MEFASDEQRKAVLAKLNPGKGLPTRPRIPLRSPYRVRGTIIQIQRPKAWLAQAAMLLKDAEKLEKAGGSNEGVFRQAYPSAEVVIKAARGEHETGKKGHGLARPLGKLAQGKFSKKYACLPGIAGRMDDIAAQITPEIIDLAKEVETFWPPYMDADHGPITKDAKDKAMTLAKKLNQILQPRLDEGGMVDA